MLSFVQIKLSHNLEAKLEGGNGRGMILSWVLTVEDFLFYLWVKVYQSQKTLS